MTSKGPYMVAISFTTTFLNFSSKRVIMDTNSSITCLLCSLMTTSMKRCAKVEINSSTFSSLILLISYFSSRAALALVTSAFFLNKAINRLMFASWYSTIWVELTKWVYSYVRLSLDCRYVADSWLKMFVFWPKSSPVSVFFFLSLRALGAWVFYPSMCYIKPIVKDL